MLQIKRSENFGTKFRSLGPTSQDHFILRWYAVWQELLDIHATDEKPFQDVRETILGSNKKFRAYYSRQEGKILLDIIDDNS